MSTTFAPATSSVAASRAPVRPRLSHGETRTLVVFDTAPPVQVGVRAVKAVDPVAPRRVRTGTRGSVEHPHGRALDDASDPV